jgi:hypothetical protein
MCARNVNVKQREGNSITLNLLDPYAKRVLEYPFQVNDIHSVTVGSWFKRGLGSMYRIYSLVLWPRSMLLFSETIVVFTLVYQSFPPEHF